MIEIWKDVLDYEGLYQASNLGRIRSLKFGKIFKPQKQRCGYLHVGLHKKGKGKTCTIHRLVYEAFNGKIPEGLQVNHINEDKSDNRLENLNLMTPKENLNWGTRNQRSVETKSKRVGQFTLDGVLIKIWSSTMECGRNGFNQSVVAACCRGERKTHKGYRWKYL